MREQQVLTIIDTMNTQTKPKIIFDSDELAPCYCGSKTLLIEFFEDGDWTMSCPRCGRRWMVKGDIEVYVGENSKAP